MDEAASRVTGKHVTIKFDWQSSSPVTENPTGRSKLSSVQRGRGPGASDGKNSRRLAGHGSIMIDGRNCSRRRSLQVPVLEDHVLDRVAVTTDKPVAIIIEG